MCGIIGYTGTRLARPILMEGLKRLEYRGYDSAGIALVAGGRLKTYRAAGKLAQLEAVLPKRSAGRTGIGHTRWATHGAPTEANAHPHLSHDGRVAVVHNGIIENADTLRTALESQGITFTSQTDTEALAHLIALEPAGPLQQRVRNVLSRVYGTYGIAVCALDEPDSVVVARNGSPVIIGIGEREMFVASDVGAIVAHTQQVVHLDDGEIAVVRPRGFETCTLDNQPRDKRASTVADAHAGYERGEHAHFMRKEILDQPEAVARTLSGRLDHRFNSARLDGLEMSARDWLAVRRVKLLGCGSAYYASLSGAQMIESLARIPADAEPAAEFRYRNPVIEPDTLYIAVSQSGETLDTLMAVNEVRRRGGRVLGIVNVVGSSIAREVDGGIYIHAGPEISVASTKAYSCTVVALAMLALHVGRIRDLSPANGKALVHALEQLPDALRQTLALEARIEAIAQQLSTTRNAFFVGRGIGFPSALEGAQKLKEISYIHAEAYPSSELKHGPLALVCADTPTVMTIPNDGLEDKAIASVQEIRAREGQVIAVTCGEMPQIAALADTSVAVPASAPELAPLTCGVALQLLAYHTALALGRDIDQPRNLAKSVTVE